eukprot:512931-Lingulodinium_polyedra.AAC.1
MFPTGSRYPLCCGGAARGQGPLGGPRQAVVHPMRLALVNLHGREAIRVPFRPICVRLRTS